LRAFALCPEDLSPKDPGDRFAARERELSGKDGFEKVAAQGGVAEAVGPWRPLPVYPEDLTGA